MNKCIACGADASRHVFNENNYDWLRCMNCGLLYASGREKTINDKVAGEYDSIQEFSSSREKIFCRELKTIKKIINKGLLLDVGCGTGIFIKQALDNGYSVQGIEPDINYYEYAVKRTGVPVIKGFLRDIKADNKYDIITYWDVLEHTPDPKNELVNVKKHLKDKGVLVLTAIQPFSSMLVMSNLEMFKYEWIWVKNRSTNYLNSKHQPLRNSEHILVFYKKIPLFNQIPFSEEEYEYRAKTNPNKSGSKNYGSHIIKQDMMTRKPTSAKNVIFFDCVHPDSNEYFEHPTQKPVALFEYLIKTYTNEGDLVLDNCMGSGTTAIACIRINRNYIGMELSEDYVKISNERIQKEFSQTKLEVKQEAMQSEARHSSQD